MTVQLFLDCEMLQVNTKFTETYKMSPQMPNFKTNNLLTTIWAVSNWGTKRKP